METINGYTVIADKPVMAHTTDRIILAVREFPERAPTRYEYVVARTAHRGERPTFWNHGEYTSSIVDAVERYTERG